MAKRTRREIKLPEDLRSQVGLAAVCDAATELMTGVPDMENKLFMFEVISETEWPAAEEMYGAILRSCQNKPKLTVSLFLRLTAANISVSEVSPAERLSQLDRLDQLFDMAKQRGLVSRRAGNEVDKLADEAFKEIAGKVAEQGTGCFHQKMVGVRRP